MTRNELEELVSTLESGFQEVESILEDDTLSNREKIDAIAAIAYDEDLESDEEDTETDE
jgi:hypothetical protein